MITTEGGRMRPSGRNCPVGSASSRKELNHVELERRYRTDPQELDIANRKRPLLQNNKIDGGHSCLHHPPAAGG